MKADIRLGRWQDVLADVDHVDALICDPPYSARTIAGQRSGTVGFNDGPRATIKYAGLTEEATRSLVGLGSRLRASWLVIFCDHVQWMWLDDEASRVGKKGMQRFAPVPWVKSCGGTPRMTADGPSASAEWIFVARPRGAFHCAYRPGHYDHPANREGRGADTSITGAKPLALMRAIVRDYSRPGDLVCDPFLGSGTTAVAALTEGRRFVGSEMDPKHHAITMARLARGHTPNLFGDV